MTGSFLSPPSNYTLSDNVIGGVVQRVASLHHGFVGNRDVYRTYTSARSLGNAEAQQSHSFLNRKRLPPLESLSGMTAPSPLVSQHEAAPPRKMRVSASRRERCRINQARYRKRQRKHAEDLDESIRQLKEEVQDLETKRQTIVRRAPTNESVWIVATEYFRLFQQGYTAPESVAKPSSTSSFTLDVSRVKPSNPQLDFLKASMSPDVIDGTLSGPETLLENWRLLSLNFGDIKIKLKRLEQNVTSNSLIGKTVTSLTITEKTLRNVFPHLVSSGELSPLASRLLNQRLVMRGSVHFEWDAANGRVVRLESKVDMLSTMLKLLGSLEDVGRVFERALITPEGKFVQQEVASSSTPTSTSQQSP